MKTTLVMLCVYCLLWCSMVNTQEKRTESFGCAPVVEMETVVSVTAHRSPRQGFPLVVPGSAFTKLAVVILRDVKAGLHEHGLTFRCTCELFRRESRGDTIFPVALSHGAKSMYVLIGVCVQACHPSSVPISTRLRVVSPSFAVSVFNMGFINMGRRPCYMWIMRIECVPQFIMRQGWLCLLA